MNFWYVSINYQLSNFRYLSNLYTINNFHLIFYDDMSSNKINDHNL